MFTTTPCRAAGNLAACVFIASYLLPLTALRSQELLLLEDFETDCDGTRYEVEGGEAIGEAGKYNLTSLGEIAFLNAIRIFTPEAGPVDNFTTTDISRNPADQMITLTWNSRTNATYATYAIENTTDFEAWEEIEDGIESGGQSSSMIFQATGQNQIYRVRLE